MFTVTEINDGALLRFEMRSETGELESSFKVNPYDMYLPQKMQEVLNELKTLKDKKVTTPEEWAAFDEDLAYLLSAALGGNQEGSMFRKYAPTEQIPSGEVFCVLIVKEVCKACREYIQRRRQRFVSRSFDYKK